MLNTTGLREAGDMTRAAAPETSGLFPSFPGSATFRLQDGSQLT